MTNITRTTRLGFATTTSYVNTDEGLRADLPAAPAHYGNARKVVAAIEEVARHGSDYGVRVWADGQLIGGRGLLNDLRALASGELNTLSI